MNKKPRWKDREGNLYTDGETVHRDENRYVVGTEIVVIPVTKKFPKSVSGLNRMTDAEIAEWNRHAR